ncbi:MAG: EamA family transporter RarD [Treponema sp.]|nr:EamA family transporter RarD [Treponema sp.]
MTNTPFGKGLFFACLAFFLWGMFTMYWRLLIAVHPLHILALRILLSLALVGTILLAKKNFAWLAAFKKPKNAGFLVLAGLLLCCNWGLYIWAINHGRTIEASLGYYINPLVSVLLGLLFFRERLLSLQWIAVAVAFLGVLILAVLSGVLPWISIVLAMTFGFYSLLKKKLSLSALESLGAETLASMPIGFLLLFVSFGQAEDSVLPVFAGRQGLAYFATLPVHTLALLALCGVVTMLPLYFFARSAKLLPLSAIGFTQFIGPTIQFLIGLFVFGEPFPPHYVVAFVLIWIAVILYIVSLKPMPRTGQKS